MIIFEKQAEKGGSSFLGWRMELTDGKGGVMGEGEKGRKELIDGNVGIMEWWHGGRKGEHEKRRKGEKRDERREMREGEGRMGYVVGNSLKGLVEGLKNAI